MLSQFRSAKIEYIMREQNAHGHLLSKLASTKKKNRHLIIQQTIVVPRVTPKTECMSILEDQTWMTPLTQYLNKVTREIEQEEAIWQKNA